jgi:hypothetical protein
MRHPLLLLIAGAIGIWTAPAAAQAKSAGQAAEKEIVLDRWLTKPTPIRLDATQGSRFDSLKVQFVAETEKIEAESRAGTDRMATVGKMSALTLKYHDAVRALLTAEQRTTFDANVLALRSGRARSGGS